MIIVLLIVMNKVIRAEGGDYTVEDLKSLLKTNSTICSFIVWA